MPLATTGLIIVIRSGQFLGLGLWFLVAATVVGWFAVNQFGFFENDRMRRQLERILASQDRQLPEKRFFVGFASPKYSNILDAHEDVGFLCFEPNSISFISETRTLQLNRSDIKALRFRMNPHSVIFLGRWISIEAKLGGQEIRLQIEPRERRTLFGNRRFSMTLLKQLQAWLVPVK